MGPGSGVGGKECWISCLGLIHSSSTPSVCPDLKYDAMINIRTSPTVLASWTLSSQHPSWSLTTHPFVRWFSSYTLMDSMLGKDRLCLCGSSLLSPQHMVQCLAHCSCSINLSNGWMVRKDQPGSLTSLSWQAFLLPFFTPSIHFPSEPVESILKPRFAMFTPLLETSPGVLSLNNFFCGHVESKLHDLWINSCLHLQIIKATRLPVRTVD